MPPTYEAGANATGNGTPRTVAKPSGTVEGDLLVALGHDGEGNTAFSLTGWTQVLFNTGGNNQSSTILYKVATASEPASYAFNCVNGRSEISVFRISGYDTADPFGGQAYGGGFGSISIAGFTPDAGNQLLLAITGCESASAPSAPSLTTDDPTWTLRGDLGNTASYSRTYSAPRTAATATGNISMSSGDWSNISVVAINAAPAATFAPRVMSFS